MGKRQADSQHGSSSEPYKKKKANNGTAIARQPPPPSLDTPAPEPGATTSTSIPKKPRINKLTPRRPWPTVPTSVSATGPRSAHIEGKNYICITRKTPLGAYMRRCKDVIYKDGYKTLHLSAMGAAIPQLTQLAAALPPILKDDVRVQITTGTAEVQDEVLPENDDEDVEIKSRSKSTLLVIMKIGPDDPEDPLPQRSKTKKAQKTSHGASSKASSSQPPPEEFTNDGRPVHVFVEPEQMDE